MADEFRTELKTELFCDVHPGNRLRVSSQSKRECDSAYDLTLKLRVHPCSLCKRELDDLKHALSVIAKAGKEASNG